MRRLLLALAAAPPRLARCVDCDPQHGHTGQDGQFTITCPNRGAAVGQIKILKANWGGNCNEQCDCTSGHSCQPCCGSGGPCCPSCLHEKGNDYAALSAACDGKQTCTYPGPQLADPAGGCGKDYDYTFGCCGDDVDYSELSWGSEFVIVLLSVSGLYLAAGGYIKQITGSFPQGQYWSQLAGLTRDGLSFCRAGGEPAEGQEKLLPAGGGAKAAAQSAGAGAAPGVRARRGEPNALHTEAALGNSAKLSSLLEQQRFRGPKAGGGSPLDDGDHRSWTPLHCASAAGHTACAEALLAAGADPFLLNDTGLTAWELAEQLKRPAVLALRDRIPPPSPPSPASAAVQEGAGEARERGTKKRRSKEKKPRKPKSTKASKAPAPSGAGLGTGAADGRGARGRVVL